MLITISGPPGSGTTTASARAAERLNLELVPGGEVFRAMAREHAMSLATFGDYAAERPDIDVELDTRLAARARKGEVVIESRLAGWIAHNDGLRAVSVWLECDARVRAERVAARDGCTADEALAANRERQRVERERWLALYGVDIDDLSIYDLVLDSGELSANEIADHIVDATQTHRW